MRAGYCRRIPRLDGTSTQHISLEVLALGIVDQRAPAQALRTGQAASQAEVSSAHCSVEVTGALLCNCLSASITSSCMSSRLRKASSIWLASRLNWLCTRSASQW
jgi:hypothetical protein